EPLVNLARALVEQEEAASDQDDVPPGYRMAEHREQRPSEPDDPGDRGEQREPGDQRQRQPYPPRPILAFRRQAAGEDRNEHQIVYTEDNLERRQCQEACPDLRIAQPIHPQRSEAVSVGGVGYPLY